MSDCWKFEEIRKQGNSMFCHIPGYQVYFAGLIRDYIESLYREFFFQLCNKISLVTIEIILFKIQSQVFKNI